MFEAYSKSAGSTIFLDLVVKTFPFSNYEHKIIILWKNLYNLLTR